MLFVQAEWVNWLMIGLLVGWFASITMKTRQGLLTDVGIGIAGALSGGFIISLLGTSDANSFTIWTWAAALIGAVVILTVVRLFTGTSRLLRHSWGSKPRH